MQEPCRGEIWMVDLSPARGHEQAGRRPGFVISVDQFNHGPSGIVILIPITTKHKGIPFHVKIEPPEGGLEKTSYIKCEDIRSVSKERLYSRRGVVSEKTIRGVEDCLRILCDL